MKVIVFVLSILTLAGNAIAYDIQSCADHLSHSTTMGPKAATAYCKDIDANAAITDCVVKMFQNSSEGASYWAPYCKAHAGDEKMISCILNVKPCRSVKESVAYCGDLSESPSISAISACVCHISSSSAMGASKSKAFCKDISGDEKIQACFIDKNKNSHLTVPEAVSTCVAESKSAADDAAGPSAVKSAPRSSH